MDADFHTAELERVQTTAERYFNETGRRHVAMLVVHRENEPVVSVVIRHVETPYDDEESHHLVRAIAEAASLIQLMHADTVTLVVPEKINDVPALSVMVFGGNEVGLRKVTYTFTEDGRFATWAPVPPEKMGGPGTVYVGMIAYLLRGRRIDPMLSEVMFTTLTKRGHSVYVVDEKWDARWKQIAA